MRVGIDGTSWSNRRGYGRFTRGVVGELLAAPNGHEFTLFVDLQTFQSCELPPGAAIVVVPTKTAPTVAASAAGRRSMSDLLAMTRAVQHHDCEAFFFPTVYTYFPLLNRPQVILGIHDVMAEEYPDLIFPDLHQRRLWRAKGWLANRQADYIVTVSAHARAGIIRHFHHPPKRVWVVNDAPDPIFRHLAPAEIDWSCVDRHRPAPGAPFLIYLGGINPHKNVPMLIDAIAQLRRRPRMADLGLVIVGEFQQERFTPGVEAVRQRVARHGLESAVHFAGRLDDEPVVHLLNTAKALVLPSFSEGFGLPAVEAAACGLPIVATRNSPLPELLFGGGLFIDPAQPDQLVEALDQLLGDEERRLRMGRVAHQRVQRLSWTTSAQQFLALLETMSPRRSLWRSVRWS